MNLECGTSATPRSRSPRHPRGLEFGDVNVLPKPGQGGYECSGQGCTCATSELSKAHTEVATSRRGSNKKPNKYNTSTIQPLRLEREDSFHSARGSSATSNAETCHSRTGQALLPSRYRLRSAAREHYYSTDTQDILPPPGCIEGLGKTPQLGSAVFSTFSC